MKKEKFSWKFKAVVVFGFLGAVITIVSFVLTAKTNNILLTIPFAIGEGMMVVTIYLVLNEDKVPVFKE